MEKKVKKLTLAKETVRNLEETKLPAVAGGYSETCPSVQVVCKTPPSDYC